MQTDSLQRAIDTINVKLAEIGGHPVTLVTVATTIAIVVLSFLLSRVVQGAIVRALGPDGASAPVSTRRRPYVTVAAGFPAALQTAATALRALFAAGALSAVGIGFAIQNVAQNFLSGAILPVDHSFR